MENTPDEKSKRSVRRRLHFVLLGATGALLIQASVVAGEGAAAGPNGARAVEAGRRSDPAAASPPGRAALKLRMDEMRQRRSGRRQRRQQELRRLTPDERRQRIKPKPLPRRQRERDLGDALERINGLRGRLGAPAITVQP